MKEKDIVEAVKTGTNLRVGGGKTRGGGDFGVCESGIVSYSPDELLITVKTGTPMEEFEAALAEKGQMLAQEPMDHRALLGRNGVPTIGGAIGVNADGPRRLRFGAIKEAVLGLRFVDGRGEIVRAGGVVMKNVTGLDLTKFFVGSRGVLGVALEASFKLLPLPREVKSRAFELSLEDFEGKVLPLLREPLEISGAVYAGGKVYLRQEGELLAPLQERLQNLLGAGDEVSNEIWSGLRDWNAMAHHDEIWRIYLRPMQAAAMARELGGEFMILCGGAQVVVAQDEERVRAALKPGQFAICEKGEKLGKRVAERDLMQEELRAKLRGVFDPDHKFGEPDAH